MHVALKLPGHIPKAVPVNGDYPSVWIIRIDLRKTDEFQIKSRGVIAEDIEGP